MISYRPKEIIKSIKNSTETIIKENLHKYPSTGKWLLFTELRETLINSSPGFKSSIKNKNLGSYLNAMHLINTQIT